MEEKEVSFAFVITIVAVIVIVSVGIGLFVGTRGGGGSSDGLGGRGAPPNALLSVAAAKVDSTRYVLTISHEGGDDLLATDLQVMTSDSATTMTTYSFPGTGTFSLGTQTSLTCYYSPDVTDQLVTVYIIHVPSKEKIFSSSIISVMS